jgi:hypothetical protein
MPNTEFYNKALHKKEALTFDTKLEPICKLGVRQALQFQYKKNLGFANS